MVVSDDEDEYFDEDELDDSDLDDLDSDQSFDWTS